MSKELIVEFIEYLQQANKSHSTVIAYRKDLEQVLEYSDKPLLDLDTQELQYVLDKIQKQFSFSAKTVSRKINSLRTFYNFVKQKGLIQDNPASSIEHPKVKNKPPRILSHIENQALRGTVYDNFRLYHMVELMLQTGLRISEVSRLKFVDVKLTNRAHDSQLHIRPYSTLSERQVPLNDKAYQLLRKYLADLDAYPKDYPLFPTRDGKHIIIRNIRSSIDRALTKAGIEGACVNDLRNTFIVKQLKSGLSIDFIAEVVGHKSKSTTQKYLELLEDDYKPQGINKLVEV